MVTSSKLSAVTSGKLSADAGLSDSTTAEHTLAGLVYSGTTRSQNAGCVRLDTTALGPMCGSYGTYWNFTALDQAHALLRIAFNATIKTGVTRTMTASSAPMSWDSGDDDLPGTSES